MSFTTAVSFAFRHSRRFSCRVPLSGFLILLIAAGSVAAADSVDNRSPDGAWEEVPETVLSARGDPAVHVLPQRCRVFQLNATPMHRAMQGAPREFSAAAAAREQILSVPMPDGTYQRFRITESPILHPALEAKFPEIRTFVGRSIDDASMTGRFDWTPKGFHAQIVSPDSRVYVDPHLRGDTSIYVSYFRRDRVSADASFSCMVPGSNRAEGTQAGNADGGSGGGGVGPVTGDTLRTYRLAVACTGEYAQFHGGTVPGAMAAIVTTMNRVVGIYELEFAVRMEIIANNDSLIFLDSGTDPYSNNDGGAMLSQNQTTVNDTIGSANYDIGHVFSTGGGGVAGLGVVCRTFFKARGVTGRSAPVGDSFDVDFVAHEIGHQFDCDHTFNGDSGSCTGGNRNQSTAYEPGSGTTIMAYAGICGNDDLQNFSDPYFHSASHDQITAFITSGSGGDCDVAVPTGNNPPTVEAGPDYTIPAATPFRLTAAGNDADLNDLLTINWEERDIGPQNDVGAPDNGSSPLFRSWLPTVSPTRYFPRLTDLLNNTLSIGEQLPTTSRIMTFRATVRDNRLGGGGYNADDMQVTVDGGSGPFRVLFPNSAIVLSGIQTILWDVAGTTGTPVNASTVNILLSTDGGLTYDSVLASNIVNDGSAQILLPNINTTTARVLVEGNGNIFFDISDSNFEIEQSDHLAVDPPFGFASRGKQGGPFTPLCQTYSLTNQGISSLTWTSALSDSWISVSPAGGTIPVGVSTNVDVCISSTATQLLTGNYSGSVAFTNLSTGEGQLRAVDLEVTPLGGAIQLSTLSTNVIESAGNADVAVERVGDTTGAVGITYTTVNGSALGGSDYVATTSTVSWANGESGAKIISILILDDMALEPLEFFQIALSNPTGGAQIGSPASSSVDIQDDDSNDQCDGAVPMDSFPFAFNRSTLADATSTGDPVPGCVPTFGNGVWFSFIAPTSGTFSVDLSGSDFDTGLGVYTGTCSSLDEIACDDDGGGDLTSSLTIPVTGGLTYYVLAGGYNSQVGLLSLQADFVPGSVGGVSNDSCTNATVIASVPFSDLLDTLGATTGDDPEPSCVFQMGKGVWYTFTAPGYGWLKVDTFNSGFDTGLGVYTGECANLSEIDCNDDSDVDIFDSKVVLPVVPGKKYFILAGGYSGGSGILSFHADFVSGLCVDIINDGGFEEGPSWESWVVQFSDEFGTPICSTSTCPVGAVNAPFDGDNWIDFVHPDGVSAETAGVGQTVVIPSGTSAELRFQLWISEVGGFKTDLLEVLMDAGVEASYQEPQVAELGYSQRIVNLDAFADDTSHSLLFDYSGRIIGGFASFQVDNIELQVCLPDVDGDGIPDDSDLDNDNDGLPDAWELDHGLNPMNPSDALIDSDGDLRSNLEEFIADTVPTNILSFLRLQIDSRTNPGEQPLSFDSSSNREYFIDFTTNLFAPNWQPALTNEPGNGGVKSVTVTNSDETATYRLGVEGP